MRQLWRGAFLNKTYNLAHMIRRHLNIIHSPINYCSCSCSYLIFVLLCIAGSDENYASHSSELSQLHQQPVDAVVRPTFIRKLCYKQWCSGAGTRGNVVPVNILARERRSHKCLSCKWERYIVTAFPEIFWNWENCCHQMSDFKAKMHQIRCRLGLRPRPHWGSLQRSPDPLAGFKVTYF